MGCQGIFFAHFKNFHVCTFGKNKESEEGEVAVLTGHWPGAQHGGSQRLSQASP